MAMTRSDELKAEAALECAFAMAGTKVPDQDEINEWTKIFGSLHAGFSTPGWQTAVPALTDEVFKTRMAARGATILVTNEVPSITELTEFPKVVGSLLKAFATTEWTSKVPAFAATPVAGPVGPPAPPPA